MSRLLSDSRPYVETKLATEMLLHVSPSLTVIVLPVQTRGLAVGVAVAMVVELRAYKGRVVYEYPVAPQLAVADLKLSSTYAS